MLTPEEIESLNISVTNKMIELVIFKNFHEENPRARWLNWRTIQTFKEELVQFHHKLLQRM